MQHICCTAEAQSRLHGAHNGMQRQKTQQSRRKLDERCAVAIPNSKYDMQPTSTYPAHSQRQRHQQQQSGLLLRLLLALLPPCILRTAAVACTSLTCGCCLPTRMCRRAAVVALQQLLQPAMHGST
jgi:hypothetical protein